MRFTPQYGALQEQLHQRPDYGVSGAKHADRILDMAKRMNTRDILDYGCGKGLLAKNIPFAIREYDPFIEGKNAEPLPADLVVCSDVMEHIEPECVEDVIIHLHSLTNKALFLDIATRPAQKVLADGRNAHLIQERSLWWLVRFGALFELQSMMNYGGGFIAAYVPLVRDK